MSGELAGRLSQRVRIERREGARDGLGGASGGWVLLREAWAEVAPEGGAPVSEADARAANPRWRVLLRSEGTEPEVGDRLVWRGKTLIVRAVFTDPRTPDRIELGTEEKR